MKENEKDSEKEAEEHRIAALHDKVDGVCEEMAACLANAVELDQKNLADRLRKAQQILQ